MPKSLSEEGVFHQAYGDGWIHAKYQSNLLGHGGRLWKVFVNGIAQIGVAYDRCIVLQNQVFLQVFDVRLGKSGDIL